MKKFISTITALAVALGTLSVPQVCAKAEEFTPVEPVMLKSFDEFDQKAEITCEAEFKLPEGSDTKKDQDLEKTFEVVIEQDSIVRFDVKATGNDRNYFGFNLYSYGETNQASLGFTSTGYSDYTKSNKQYSTRTEYIHLSKGTHFLTLAGYYEGLGGYDWFVKLKTSIAAVPTSKIFGLTAKDKTLKLVNKFPEESTAFLFKGKYKQGDTYPAVDEFTKNSKTANKSGWYTVVYLLDSNEFNDNLNMLYLNDYNSVFITKLVDIDKPVVTGVKNDGTYKKATIKFSDKHSGIKSATLNGKSVKSGVKVTKAGSYKLVVKDKHGNTRTVKFKIKK